MKLYWVIFPIMELRQAVETVNTNKRKDRQLAGQTSLTPFMSIREGFKQKGHF